MKTILLKLAGPLQSWGTDSRFETRSTDRYPSKSAIIGMIAGSFGVRREDNSIINDLKMLDFAVRVDQQGSLLRDYQIAAKFKKSGEVERTYVTNRYYLQDAVFVVAIGSEDEAFIDRIEKALKNPYFQPFLGRRSIPINADYYIKKTNESVIESLKSLPWQASKTERKKVKKLEEVKLEIYADSNLVDGNKNIMIKDLPISFSQTERKYSFRSVTKMQINVSTDINNKIEHDALSVLGGQ